MDCLCRPSRIMSVRINLLDETDFIYELKDDLPGQALLDVVFARLNLIETTYFGIRYIDEENQTHWLDAASRISRQLKPKPSPFDLYFGVKFYAADPCKLLEEITRYQLFLQVKQDVLQGRLPVSFELAAELGAFVVQSELGDYDQRRHSKGYVSEFRLLPNQTSELETRVAELHQQLKGMTPAAAELNYLDKVKWHDMYGVDLHPVLGEDSVEYFLGLTPSGIVVLRNKTMVAHYYWPRIAKVYYKGRYFMLRICDKNNELSTYGFETPRKAACKHLWRCCVEHHAFFRLVRVAPLQTSQSATSDLFALGSRLRYSSRTEKQATKDSLSVSRAPPAFIRVPSKRQPRRVIDDFLNVNRKNFGGHENFNSVGNGGFLGLAKAQDVKSAEQINYDSPYRSTYSIPASLGIRPYNSVSGNNNNSSAFTTPDSPRSTRSAPWPRTQQRSLFGNNPSSPRSVRSAGTSKVRHRTSSTSSRSHTAHPHHQHQQRHNHQHHVPTHQHATTTNSQRYRSSSVESHSSNDSRSLRRHKHRHRRTSDNESELSRGSGRSGRSYHSHHRKHRKSRHRCDSGGSENESTRDRSYSGHRISSSGGGSCRGGLGSSTELIDSTTQWREVQRRQAEQAGLGQSSVQQASVSKSSMVARSHHSNDSHSDTHSHHKSRRHKKNKSPSDSRNRIWSSELAKHLQFGLVDTAGMTEDQLREIPYTVVETNLKRSGVNNLKIHKSGSNCSGLAGVGNGSNCGSIVADGRSNNIESGNNTTNNGQGKNRVDRIRGLYFQNSNPNDSSIRSASTISSRECERNSGLVRMMSSMSMGDFISPTSSSLSPLDNSALRVSHEHTDSGLGADQDYAYSSERSSDSTRYGTNKSSGASSGSHRKSNGSNSGGGGIGATTTFNNMLHQTVSSNHHLQVQTHHQRQANSSIYQNTTTSNRPQQHQTQMQSQNNYKYSSPVPVPVHNNISMASTNHCNNNNININNNNNNNNSTNPKNNINSTGNGNGNSQKVLDSIAAGCNNDRLLNYTTFENNQYKFSLNNGGGSSSNGGSSSLGIHAAAPYYYSGPLSVRMPRGTAKSDIGVPIRRPSYFKSSSSSTSSSSKQQFPSSFGHGGFSSQKPHAPSFDSRCNLASAKSDLFLSYIHSSSNAREYEVPHVYNYQMPPPLSVTAAGNNSNVNQKQQQQQQHNVAYHISGLQTSDFPSPIYKGLASPSAPTSHLYPTADEVIGHTTSDSIISSAAAAAFGRRNNGSGLRSAANDVLYYQFDNNKSMTKTTNDHPMKTTATSTKTNFGPLIYLENAGQQQGTALSSSSGGGASSNLVGAAASTATQQPSTVMSTATSNSTTATPIMNTNQNSTNTNTTNIISSPVSSNAATGELANKTVGSNIMYNRQQFLNNHHNHHHQHHHNHNLIYSSTAASTAATAAATAAAAAAAVVCSDSNDNYNETTTAGGSTTNAKLSSSLEIILTPIIQSSRRVQ